MATRNCTKINEIHPPHYVKHGDVTTDCPGYGYIGNSISTVAMSSAGMSDAEICRSMGWEIGTKLTGTIRWMQTVSTSVIKITGIGEEKILVKQLVLDGELNKHPMEMAFRLGNRDWFEVVDRPEPVTPVIINAHWAKQPTLGQQRYEVPQRYLRVRGHLVPLGGVKR